MLRLLSLRSRDGICAGRRGRGGGRLGRPLGDLSFCGRGRTLRGSCLFTGTDERASRTCYRLMRFKIVYTHQCTRHGSEIGSDDGK